MYVLTHLLLGASTRIIYKATDINGYLAMLIGVGITVLVQSSSVTTSTLTPLVGMGLIRLGTSNIYIYIYIVERHCLRESLRYSFVLFSFLFISQHDVFCFLFFLVSFSQQP